LLNKLPILPYLLTAAPQQRQKPRAPGPPVRQKWGAWRKVKKGLAECQARSTASEVNEKSAYLNVVVQAEFIRMRTQTHGIHFLGALVIDVRRQQVFGEDVALEQELMIGF